MTYVSFWILMLLPIGWPSKLLDPSTLKVKQPQDASEINFFSARRRLEKKPLLRHWAKRLALGHSHPCVLVRCREEVTTNTCGDTKKRMED